MKNANLVGKVQTVLGPVDPEALGITSSHEHILSDMSPYYLEPAAGGERGYVHQPLTPGNLAWVRTHRFSNLDNMRLTDRELAVRELLRFKHSGGNTVVEMSQNGLSRDPLGLAYVARATGLNIIMGCGYYLGLSHPQDMDGKSEEGIADEIVRDIRIGAGETGVRAGIIGEIGCSVPISANEKKVLRACALAQKRTGAPMDIHPSYDDELVLEMMEILSSAGADLSHTVISHMDVFDVGLDTQIRLLEAGCHIAYDNFGNLGYPHMYLGRIVNLAGDLERIRNIRQLIDRGYQQHILIGQDICFKDMLRAYGGFGYAHLLENVAPLMRAKEMTQDQVHALLVENPKRFFVFTQAAD